MFSLLLLLELLLVLFAAGLYLRYRRLQRRYRDLLKEREAILGFVHDSGEVFAETEDTNLDMMLKRVLFYALRTTHATAGALFLADRRGGGALRAHAVSGPFPPLVNTSAGSAQKTLSKLQFVEKAVKAEAFHPGEGLVGSVALSGKPLLIADAERDSRVPQWKEEFLHVSSLMLAPLRFHRRTLGALAVVNRTDHRPFQQSDLNLLQALADQVSISIHFDEFRESLVEKRRLDHDLDIARRIQTMLLPRQLPALPGYEVAAFTDPAQQVGGDYHFFVQVDEDHLGMAVADVSGKGISGSLVMAVCHSFLRSQAHGNPSPAAVLRAVNALMADEMMEDMFVSMLYMVLNTRTRELAVARAGHEPLLVYRQARKDLEVLAPAGLAIGLGGSDLFDAHIEEARLTLEPGDVLAAYTDGVTETQNEEGEEWGSERLRESLRSTATQGAEAVVHTVREHLARFAREGTQYDDNTLLVLRVEGAPSTDPDRA